MAAHRYWRLVLVRAGLQDVHVNEIELRSAPGGADLTAPGGAISSSPYLLTHAPTYAIDNTQGAELFAAYWPATLTYDFGVGVAHDIVEVAITKHNNSNLYAPVLVELWFSDDGVAWTKRCDLPPQGAWTTNIYQTKIFPVPADLQLQSVAGIPILVPPLSATTLNANNKLVQKFTLTRTAKIREVCFYNRTNDPLGALVRGLLYADSAGVPGARIAMTPERLGIWNGWNNLRFDADIELAPGTYYYGIHTNTTLYPHYTTNAVTGLGNWYNSADTYSDGTTDPFGTATNGTAKYLMYVAGSVDIQRTAKVVSSVIFRPGGPDAQLTAKVIGSVVYRQPGGLVAKEAAFAASGFQAGVDTVAKEVVFEISRPHDVAVAVSKEAVFVVLGVVSDRKKPHIFIP